MKDIGLNRFLTVSIGVPGLMACVLAWIQPMDVSERIVATGIGTAGVTWALIRGLSLKSPLVKQVVRTEEIEGRKPPVS